MSIAELEVSVKVLRDCYDSLSIDQVRLKETNVYLEQRIRILEQRLSEQPAAGHVGLPCPPQAAQQPGQNSGAIAPQKVALDGGGAGKESKEVEEVEEEDLVEHSVGESIWDAVVFVGLPELSRSGSAILLVAMLLNATVQVYICVVLFMSDDFMQRRRYQDLAGPMKEFRLNTGHDFKQVDTKGRSLAARVCEDDQSLSLGFRQADVLVEINAYLGLGTSDLQQQGFGTGPMLCGVCIFLFAATILRELRSIAESTWAVLAVPRGKSTVLQDGRLATMSCRRLACFLLNNVVRVGIAVMLLITGITWLSATSSITDLILNAAALSFVLDMDECLFETIVPSGVRMIVGSVEPIKYRRSYWHSEAIAPLLGLCTVIVLSMAILVSPNTADMLRVKQILCDGNLDFMVKMNGVGFMTSTNTTDFFAETGPSLVEKAVEELVGSKQLTGVTKQFSYWTEMPANFLESSSHTFLSFSETSMCGDQDTLFGGFMQVNFPAYFTATRYITGLDAGATVLESPFSCAANAGFCQTTNIVRAMCPVTCGCDSPGKMLLRSELKHGCSASCKPLRDQWLAQRPCTDMSVANSSAWRSFWMAFEEAFVADQPDPSVRTTVKSYVARKISEGCSNAELIPIANMSDCMITGLSSVSPICSARCCQGANPPPDCPPSCSASAGSGSR